MLQGCRTLSEIPKSSLSSVLVRVDFNVPIEKGEITDDTRIQAALATIKYLLKSQAKIILMSHLGSPKTIDPSLSLEKVGVRLSQLIGETVEWIPSLEKAKQKIETSSNRLFLLENMRFFPGEKNPDKDPNFVDLLASLGTYYINDAFGTAHREDASCVALASRFKGRAACGFLMEKEISFLQKEFEHPKRPFIAIIGGAKISSKLAILNRLIEKCDTLIIVGAMAYTFLASEGIEVGKSLFEPGCLEEASNILKKAQALNKKLLLPIDTVVCNDLNSPSVIRLIPTDQSFPSDLEGVDIGPRTIEEIKKIIKEAKTIFWNGPAGVFENPLFAKGTRELATLLAASGAITIVGGGDSTAAVNQMGLGSAFDHVSTGGGASLELIEKEDLPALLALRNAY